MNGGADALCEKVVSTFRVKSIVLHIVRGCDIQELCNNDVAKTFGKHFLTTRNRRQDYQQES